MRKKLVVLAVLLCGGAIATGVVANIPPPPDIPVIPECLPTVCGPLAEPIDPEPCNLPCPPVVSIPGGACYLSSCDTKCNYTCYTGGVGWWDDEVDP